MKNIIFLAFLLTISASVIAQSIVVTGYIKDDKNNRKLDDVEVSVFDLSVDGQIVTTQSTNLGNYIIEVPEPGTYMVRLMRQAYYDVETIITVDSDTKTKDLMMTRLPGYEFEGTVRERLSFTNGELGKELKNLKIEIYNNTTDKKIVSIEDDPKNTFKANFERGNHYTILLRKKGYFAKRIEAYVDIEGCILCFEGLGSNYSPEIEYELTDINQRGSLITDIPMKKIIQDEAIVLENIYYDYDKSYIRKDARPALENLVKILKRNPIIIELSSHTDSRGRDEYNMTLSQRRAQAAVDYIISRGIKEKRITARGYGESQLVNNCGNDSKCTEAEHQKNRRTEFKVTAFIEDSNFDNKSLRDIIISEKQAGIKSQETILILDK